MSLEILPPSTGSVIVDKLRDLQLLVGRHTDPDKRYHFVKERIAETGAAALIEEELMVGASRFLLRPQNEKAGVHYNFVRSVMFAGKLQRVRFLQTPELPIDMLTLDFESPAIFDTRPHESDRPSEEVAGDMVAFNMADTEAFQRSTFIVPVMAIESCMHD